MYRVSQEEVWKQQQEYKKNYPTFVPFQASPEDMGKISRKFFLLLRTQNGIDTDDYCVEDNNKVETYISGYPEGSRVLILGTGTGREVVVAKELGYNAVGTTLGSRNVYFGREHLGLTEDEIIECANENLPFQDCEFDVVAGFQVFEHAIAPMFFLTEVRRVMKRGGILFLEWPPAQDYHMDSNPHHQVCFCPGQARAMLSKAGFTDIELTYSNGEIVPDSELWSCENHGHMLCIKGKKGAHSSGLLEMFDRL